MVKLTANENETLGRILASGGLGRPARMRVTCPACGCGVALKRGKRGLGAAMGAHNVHALSTVACAASNQAVDVSAVQS